MLNPDYHPLTDAAIGGPDYNAERILVVDDEIYLAKSLAEVLELVGYEVSIATTGMEALEFVRSYPVSVALLDIRLPDMGGTELLQEIKKLAPSVACIMTTGDKSAELVVEAVNRGASGYFHKPVEPVALLSAIREKLERERLVRENLDLLKSLERANARNMETIHHLHKLQELSRTISSTLELDEVLRAVRNSVIEALGYDRCGIFLIDPETRALRGQWGADRQGEPIDLSSTVISMEGELPIAKVARGEMSYFLTDNWERYVQENFGEHPYEDLKGVRAHTLLPLIARDRTVGILSVDNLMSDKPISEEDIQQLLPFTYQAAIAIENAALYRTARETLQREMEKAAELELLWQVAQAVTSELDLNSVLDVVAGEICRAMGTRYFALLLMDNRLREMSIRTCRGLDVDHPLHGFLVGRENPYRDLFCASPAILNNLQEDPCARLSELSLDAGLRSMLFVPLKVGAECIGAIIVFSQTEDRFKERDIRLLTTLTSMAAAAIHNAQSYDRQHLIADTMQRELLTIPPDRIGRFKIGYRYQPALEESRIGGDFYDVVELPDGRAALLLADVSGKGLKAAVYTAMGKYMFRGLLVDDPSPGLLLERLNRSLCRYTEPGLFITLFYALLDPETGGLRYANAGHESPILYKAESGVPTTLDTTGVVLGVDPDAVYVERETRLNDGDLLLLYTDGVTDARRGTEPLDAKISLTLARDYREMVPGEDMLGLKGLQDVLIETIKERPVSLVKAIYEKIYHLSSGFLHDDIALLAIEAAPPGE
jgi:serine phosphatase RsbU (regulator of sigma subunit)/DNA-binding response OmpR family regulator